MSKVGPAMGDTAGVMDDTTTPRPGDIPANPLPKMPTEAGPLPVPLDEPPPVRIGRPEREVAEYRLRQALADDVLTIDEFDDRCGKVFAATTQAELDAVLVDLPAPERVPAATAANRPARVKERVVAIFSGTEERGRWRPAKPVRAVAVMGEAKVDLRSAETDDGEFVVTANAFMGSVEVIVPDDADVDLGGVAIMGERSNRVPANGSPTGPVVRVDGFAFMGSVEVRTASKRERKKYPVAGESPKRPAISPSDRDYARTAPRRSPGRRIAGIALTAFLILGPGRALATADEIVVFGSDVVNLSDDQRRGEEDVDVFVLFGSVDVPIEDGLYQVNEDVTALFGSSDCETVCDPPFGQTPITVDGFVLFGSANIGPPGTFEDDDAD